ncbi:MAG: hypothetical protein LBH39_05310 [Clostridiales Family XIII bacterium]|jgi:hypothetical protein|nr:hypothetical protein [Clostridiales Family XIII bacterium]
MRTSFKADDVTLLLKDITGLIRPQGTAEREAAIQGGAHYSEMLPIEYRPTGEYLAVYSSALANFAPLTAAAVASVTGQILSGRDAPTAIVSLARAGTPIGVLIKRYAKQAFGIDLRHYSISIIRGRGIDANAMDYILSRHRPGQLQFVDGWTGKGAIRAELDAALEAYPGVPRGLAVLSDPAFVARKYGTRQDFLIPSSCLNSTVSGLISRTVCRPDIIGGGDFHGAVYYEEFADEDRTYEFIEAVEKHFCITESPAIASAAPDASGEAPLPSAHAASGEEPGPSAHDASGGAPVPSGATCGTGPSGAAPAPASPSRPAAGPAPLSRGAAEAARIAADFGIRDINLVKPGIGEATRVLLRRLPWKILVHSLSDSEHLSHIYRLAEEKGVEIAVYPLECYRACGLIQSLTDI